MDYIYIYLFLREGTFTTLEIEILNNIFTFKNFIFLKQFSENSIVLRFSTPIYV